MDRVTIGILAHVDAGKTTLSEAMLYTTGQLRRLGRVDHRDAFLDGFALERERGITIFSKQAELPLGERAATLLDTPGHVDFSSEMERTLQVLDCAVLVVSAADGVQSHTMTLWRLLERYQIPTFLFVNKMDLAGMDRAALLAELQKKLDGGCVDFARPEEEAWEEAALTDESALGELLETGELSRNTLRGLVRRRKLFPCWFGSALRLEGVEAFLEGLAAYAPAPAYPAELAARDYTEKDLNDLIVGAVAKLDTPRKPRAEARELDRQYFCGITEAMKAADRKALCAVDAALLKEQAAGLADAMAAGVKVTFGSRDAVETAGSLFDRVETL